MRFENNKRGAERREPELESKRRDEIELRIKRLNREIKAWERAEQIRRYASALESGLSEHGPIEPDCDAAKWLKWVRSHADHIDPTLEEFAIGPQEFWEWDLRLSEHD